MKIFFAIILLMICLGGMEKRQPSSLTKANSEIIKPAPHPQNERGLIPFEPDSFYNYYNANQYLIKKFHVELNGLKDSDISDIKLIDTSHIKNFGKVQVYNVKFTNDLPEVVMKNNFLVVNPEKKQASLFLFDTLTLINASKGNNAKLLAGVKKVKSKGFYVVYDFFESKGVFKEVLNSLDYYDDGLAVFNSSIDCLSYKPFMLFLNNDDINGDGLCDINFTGVEEIFCKGLETGYGREDRAPLKVNKINFTFIAKQEADNHIKFELVLSKSKNHLTAKRER